MPRNRNVYAVYIRTDADKLQLAGSIKAFERTKAEKYAAMFFNLAIAKIICLNVGKILQQRQSDYYRRATKSPGYYDPVRLTNWRKNF
jgi:hypothetical protein